MQTVIVVGSGQAGSAVALRLRRYGFAGKIRLFGEELALPYERPPLSKSFLASEDESPKLIASLLEWEAAGIELHLGERVLRLDATARCIETDRGSYSFDTLVLATGSRVIRLPAEMNQGIQYLRTQDDARAIRRIADRQAASVVAIGAGVIGMEVASTLASNGASVTVVAPEQWPMARILPEEAGRHLADIHAAAGVHMMLGESVDCLLQSEPCITLGLASGRTISGGLIVAGIGVRPNIELAQVAGIVTKRGIVCDGYGRTAVSGIYAAGEVAEWVHPFYQESVVFENWTHANAHAELIAKDICGLPVQPYQELPWMWSDQFDQNIQVLGQMESDLQWFLRRYSDHERVWFGCNGSQRVRMVVAFNRGKDIRPCKKLCLEGLSVDQNFLVDPTVDLRAL